jgi:hypothetical protein
MIGEHAAQWSSPHTRRRYGPVRPTSRSLITRRLASVSAGLAIVAAAFAALTLSNPALATTCGVAQCATFTVTLGGNGTGVLAVVTSTGTLTNTIECHRGGNTTYGTCAWSYPLNAVIYYRVAASSGSTTTCKVVGCDTSTSIKHFTLSGNMTLSAFGFSLVNPVTLSVILAGTGGGSVSSTPVGIDCGAGHSACDVAFAAGSTVKLTETPASGSDFAGWTGACSGGNNTCSVGMVSGSPATETATFNKAVVATRTPTPTAKPTQSPKPTAAGTAKPGSTPTPRPSQVASNPTPNAPTSTPASGAGATSSPGAASTPAPSQAPQPTAGGASGGAPSLAPIDTPAADVGEAASSDASRPLLVGGLIVVLVVLGAGAAFFFRKPRGAAPGP